jgi:hypothetical protein
MADKDLEITKQSSFPRRDIDMANASENFSDLGDKTSRTRRPDQRSQGGEKRDSAGKGDQSDSSGG